MDSGADVTDVSDDVSDDVSEEDQTGLHLGAGGRLYQDARDAFSERKAERKARKPKPEPEPPAIPPWTVSATGPEPVATSSRVSRDWRQGVSTLAECVGVILISGGVAIQWPWAGLVVLGIFILLFGIAAGLPAERPKT